MYDIWLGWCRMCHVYWFVVPCGVSIVRGAILDATTWPGTIENQAGSLGFCRCILDSTVQGESGTRCCFVVVCDSMISWGLGIMFVFSLYVFYCCRSCTPRSVLLTVQFWVPPLGSGRSGTRMAHMAYICRGILRSTVQGESGTRRCPVVCDSSSSVGAKVRCYVCVYSLRLR